MIEGLRAILGKGKGTPIFELLYESIRSRIHGGDLKAGDAFPSERDFVEELGIARSTLRRAIDRLEKEGLIFRKHGLGTFVAPPENWRQSENAIQVGIVTWGAVLDGRSKDMFNCLCAEAVTARIRALALHPAPNGAELLPLDERVARENLHGIIALSTSRKSHLRQLEKISIPKVILEVREQQVGLDHVVIDSFQGVYRGVSELARMGHHEIGYIGGLVFDDSVPGEHRFKLAQDSDDRFSAYRRALEDANLDFRPEWYVELPYDKSAVDAWFLARKNSGEMPTAFVVFSDTLAQEVIAAAARIGLRVPEDLSVFGFGNSTPESQLGELATAAFDFGEMARLAVRRIQERIVQGGISGVSISVKSFFKEGRSIGAANLMTK